MSWNSARPVLAVLGALTLFWSGCVQAPPPAAWRFLQRPSVSVAILPTTNRTTKPGAQIVIDKAWEETLRKAGFTVVNADAVVTFASSRSVPLSNLDKMPTAALGQALHADFILENELIDWGTKYQVIQSVSVVSCRSQLIEARTGATVWALDWISRDDDNNNSSGGVVGLLVNAAVKAVVNAMTDVPTQLAQRGIALAGTSQPYPGAAPAAAPSP